MFTLVFYSCTPVDDEAEPDAPVVGDVAPDGPPADTISSDETKLKASVAEWDDLKAKCDGNYSYLVRTVNFPGERTETEVVVRGNQAVERRFKYFAPPGEIEAPPVGGNPAGPQRAWTERDEQVGTHKEGSPAKTLDELYAEAAQILAHRLQDSEKRYVDFDKQGLLKLCFYVDTNIADDAPTTGVMIDEIKLEIPK